MPKRILGSGWRFPVGLDRRDSIAISQHEKKIEESIFIILGTAKGERVMRPEFGCEIHDQVFSVIDTTTFRSGRTIDIIMDNEDGIAVGFVNGQ